MGHLCHFASDLID